MSQLILGTAEFGHPNYAPFPDEKEIVRILNLAWEGGIRILDCADTYGCDNLINKYGLRFVHLNKTRDKSKVVHILNSWYHYKPGESPIKDVIRASVYDPAQLEFLESAIVPMSIENTDFIPTYKHFSEYYARSIFANGRLLQQGYTVKDCLSFVSRHYVQGVIVGVKSVKELEEILIAWESIHAKTI